MIWIIFAGMTALLVVALTRPMLRPAASARDRESADIAVYRDQLDSIENERERGLMGEAEAGSARAEIGRRILDSARNRVRRGQDAAAPGPGARRAAFAVAALVPVSGLGLYLVLGSPDLPGQPRANRASPPVEQASVDELVAKVEARLALKPDDGAGWDAIAPIYMLQERFADAAGAFQRAIAALGETPKRLTGLAESSIRAGNGIVGDTARGAYERLLALEPGRIDAKFWLALGREQDGDLAGAAQGFRDILTTAPPDAPWRGPAEARLADIEKKTGAAPSGASDSLPGAGK